MKVVLVHETIHDDYNIQFAKLKSLAYSLFIKETYFMVVENMQ